jgi:hypothetical protein
LEKELKVRSEDRRLLFERRSHHPVKRKNANQDDQQQRQEVEDIVKLRTLSLFRFACGHVLQISL